MESRTPPKFVPTLTEVAAQDQMPVAEELQAFESASAPTQAAGADFLESAPDQSLASIDMLRRRRNTNAPPPGDLPVLTELDISSLPTHSGWAQPIEGINTLLPVADAALTDAGDFSVDTLAGHLPQTVDVLPAEQVDTAMLLADLPADAAASQEHAPPPDSEIAALLVAQAAEVAQALEDAITRRVLKHVQETLDERLTQAVLQVVHEQTSLLQSSLQLQLDSTIRSAVAQAVSQVLMTPNESDQGDRSDHTA